MTNIAIVYHSGYGHTNKVAEMIKLGAESISGASATLYSSESAINDLDTLDTADAIIFGAPTYMGSISAQMKQFIDASSMKWIKRAWDGKIAAGFTNSGSLSGDKLSTLIQLSLFAAQHGMAWVDSGLIAPSKDSGHGGKPEDINRIGSYLGLMTQSDNAPPENTPSPGDIESAKLFGAHVAKRTLQWTKGRD